MTSSSETTKNDGLICRAFLKSEEPALMARVLELRHRVFVDEQLLPAWVVNDELDDTVLHVAAMREVGGPVLGTVRIVPVSGSDGGRPEAKIERVAVAKELRGHGVGALVMRAALNEARRRGYRGAVLDSVTDANGFYEKLGFRAEGEEFMKVGIPHYIMRLAF